MDYMCKINLNKESEFDGFKDFFLFLVLVDIWLKRLGIFAEVIMCNIYVICS